MKNKLNHLKLFEEYRLFGANRDPWTPTLKEPSGDNPLYTVGSEYKAKKDPNEPFFNRAKKEYKRQQSADLQKKAGELNTNTVTQLFNKMGITPDLLAKLKTISYDGFIRAPRYDKEYGYYYINIYADSEGDDRIYIQYFEQENDWIMGSPDYAGKYLKKKFENISDGINWLINLKNNSKQAYRSKLRQTTESRKNKL